MTFKAIERHFYLYDQIKKAVEQEREDQLTGGRTEDSGGGGHGSSISDMTGNRAVRLADPVKKVEVNGLLIKRPEDWLQVVEATEEHYRQSLISELINRRYRIGETQVKTCLSMFVDKTTYYDWRNEAISYAAMCCCQCGLIKVY